MKNSTPRRWLLRSSVAVAIALGIYSPACAQGSGMPAVTNVTATADATARTVTFDFTIIDPENDPMEIGIQLVGTDGSSYTIPAAQLSGDIGYPVMGGTRRVVWTYAPSNPRLNGSTTYRALIVADDRFEVDIAAIIAGVDSTRLRNDLEQIVGIRHAQTGAAKLQ